MASGRRAKANHNGAFVFADSSNFDFNSATSSEFAVRATGGTRFVSAIDGSGNPTAGVQLAAGGGSWSSLSDRAAKAGFAPIDGRDILERLAEVPVETWSYRSQQPSIRHIGPMAQDFYAAFAVGEDDRHISTIDADGVALAAIQGLHELLQEREAQIAALEARMGAVEQGAGVSSPRAAILSYAALPWLLLAAAVVGGLAAVRRFRKGGL